jgi:alpha-amylase/alpha-mannosidase (GH57 family)
MTLKYICIHGHFYQPPRENPWLEQIEIQESARPFHDWNQRVAYECYRPNSRARILDQNSRLREVINNYEHISFDFGPTLLSWLERHAADAYQAILEADIASAKMRSGHGNALAHAYNHMILPLASSRDKLTQILWGIEDFRRRFKREPEGMWLPETAVDTESLSILATNGIKFTLLAPSQARRFRASSKDNWVSLNPGSIDPSRPYLCRLPKGRHIVIFFYDGPISRAIAFEGLLDSGEELRNRLVAAFSEKRAWPQLVHIATDGESYGHHHRFGEMALAYALERLMAEPDLRLTNYGEYLELHPSTAEVEIIQNSAWSCAHGVGRWSQDCGCSVSQRPDWNQKWRTPLRKALDIVRDRVDTLFEQRGSSIFKRPWEARDDYIKVVLEDRPRIGPFFKNHGLRRLNKESRTEGLRLLELQRNRMLMYTSCGWFFDDISGIETLQILRYAARVLQIAYPYDPAILKDFLAVLARARSNVKPCPHGDEIFTGRILPEVSDLSRVAAHAAIMSVFENAPMRKRLYCYDIKVSDALREDFAGRTLFVCRMTVLSRITTESRELSIAVLYLGGIDVRCSADEDLHGDKYESAKQDMVDTFRGQSSTELIRKLDRYFAGKYYSITDLFVEQRRAIMETVTEKMYEAESGLFEAFYERNKDLGKLIVNHEARLPDTFLAAARFALNRALRREIQKLADGAYPDELHSVVQETKSWKIRPDLCETEKLLRNRILTLVGDLAKNPANNDILAEIVKFLDLCDQLGLQLELGEAQTRFFRTVMSLGKSERKKLLPTFAELADRLAVCLPELNRKTP